MYIFLYFCTDIYARDGEQREGKGWGKQHLLLVGEIVVVVETLLVNVGFDKAAAEIAAV